MPAHLLIGHVVRILELIHAAVLASEVAYVRNEKYGLKGGLPAEKTGSEKPPAQIKQFSHIIRK